MTFIPGPESSNLSNRLGAFTGIFGGSTIFAAVCLLAWIEQRIPAATPKEDKLNRADRKRLKTEQSRIALEHRIKVAEREAGIS